MENTKNKIVKIYRFLKILGERYSLHSTSAYSAQMAFFLILSIFPFFILLFTILGKFSIDSTMFISILETFFPEEVHYLIINFIKEYIVIENSGVVPVTIVGTIWSASKGVRALTLSINKAYDIHETRNFFITKFIDIVYTIIIVIGIVVFLTLPNIGLEFYVFITKYIPINVEIFALYMKVKIITIPVIMFLVLVLTYKFIPNIRVKFSEVIYGSIFSILGWAFLSYVFAIFLNHFAQFKVIYGSLATVIILMFWLYISSNILLLGGEINSVIREQKKDH